MRSGHLAVGLLLGFAAVFALADDSSIPAPPEPDPSGRFVQAIAVRSVQDGDTLYLADGRYVRLIGIDTPEFARPNSKRPWEGEDEAFARDAAQAVSARLGVPFARGERPEDASTDRKARLELDHDLEDDHGRVLGYVWIQDAEGAWSMLNTWILRQGLAFASRHPGTTRHAQAMLVALREAKEQKLGIWGTALPFDVGPAWRTEGEKGAGYFHYQDRCGSVPRPAEGDPRLFPSWLAAVESGLAPCGQCDYLYRSTAGGPQPEK